jgi:hypothetical protein
MLMIPYPNLMESRMMKLSVRFRVALVVMGSLVSSPALNAQKYGQEVSKQWKDLLSLPKSAGDYTWFAYPVDNFGVITSYGAPANGKQLVDSDRICATCSCIGIEDAQIPTDDEKFISVSGFADKAKGSSIHLTNDKNGKAAISLVLSNLLSAVGVNGDVNLSKDVTVDLTADAIYERSINKVNLTKYLDANKDGLLYTFWHSGTLTYIGADIVAHNITITLTLDTNKSVALDASLAKAIGQFGSGTKANVNVSSTAKGSYTVKYPGFLILATQIHHQFGPGALFGADKDEANKEQKLEDATSNTPQPEVNPTTLTLTKASALSK